jgi:hypothetical protein
LVNIWYLRKNKSTLFALSAAVVLLSASPLTLSNLLQPVQAQSSVSFRTTQPIAGVVECSSTGARLTFDAQGTPSSSNPQRVDIAGGSFQINDRGEGGQILYSGNIYNGRFNNGSGGGGSLILYTAVNHVPNGTSTCASTGDTLTIDTSCSTSNGNPIEVGFLGQDPSGFGNFNGAVNCSQGEDSTQSSSSSSSSSMTGTTTQDRDGDRIPDANDNCPNLPHTRCYKEGDTAVVVHNNSNG